MTPVASATKLTAARIPYLNCAPFFDGLAEDSAWEWTDLPPRMLGEAAANGRVAAGAMASADFFRLRDSFERLGALGIAVRGRCISTLLFSKRPVRMLDGAVIAVSSQSSTTALLARLILEDCYKLSIKEYRAGEPDGEADAVLLIGDDCMRFRKTSTQFPFEIDLAFEWWLWQHLPFVFAVWAVRMDAPAAEKQRLSRMIQHQLAVNLRRLPELAAARAAGVSHEPSEVAAYLEHFVYRLSEPEEQGLQKFEQLLREHRLLGGAS